jgi:hypothetical protein
MRGFEVGIDPSIEGGAAYTPENLQSFVSSIPAPVDPGIAGALPGGQGTTPLSFTDQLNALFQANLGRLPTEREASIYSKDFGGAFSPELEAAFMSRSTEEMVLVAWNKRRDAAAASPKHLGYINQPTRHIAKRGKHLLVATILNQE